MINGPKSRMHVASGFLQSGLLCMGLTVMGNQKKYNKNHVNEWSRLRFQETFLRKTNETEKMTARHRLMAAPVDAPR